MDAVGVLGLVGLALVDSTSIGTLVIPIWLLLRPPVRPRLILLYLSTITLFYFLVGLVLMSGARAVLPLVASALDAPAVRWAQLVVAVGLFGLSFWIDPKAVRKRRDRAGLPVDQVPSWQRRIDHAAATAGGMTVLALGAGLAEVATMLPYLGAIGIILALGLPPAGSVGVLAGYTLVMVVPALALLAARLVAARTATQKLERIGAWMAQHTATTLTWVLTVLAVLIGLDAVQALGPMDVIVAALAGLDQAS